MKIDKQCFLSGAAGFISTLMIVAGIVLIGTIIYFVGYRAAVEDCVKIAMKYNEPVAICLIMKEKL